MKPRTSYNNNKHAYDSHHQDSCAHNNRYLSSNGESRGDNCTPMPSNGEASARVGSKFANKNYHLSLNGNLFPGNSTRVIPPSSLIQWDDAFDDGYLTNFEKGDEDADLENRINHSRLAIDAPH